LTLSFAAASGCGSRTSLLPYGADEVEEAPAADCAGYCRRYVTACAFRTATEQECLDSCQVAEDAASAECQQLQVSALTCLMPFWAGECQADDAVKRCGDQIDRFQQCSATSGWPYLPVLDPQKCTQILDEGSSPDCVQEFNCWFGRYDIRCSSATPTQAARCDCAGPDLTRPQGAVVPTSNRCKRTADICLY
jgi:hypothetical protein